jgi:hypothetical protein
VWGGGCCGEALPGAAAGPGSPPAAAPPPAAAAVRSNQGQGTPHICPPTRPPAHASPPQATQGGLSEEAQAAAPAAPSELAAISWGLAQLGHRPPEPWLQALCSAAYPRLGDFHANQIWGE